MKLKSVRYQDSCIYIGLNGLQKKGEDDGLTHSIRNAYVVYKIKMRGHHVQETVLLGKRDIFVKKDKILLKLEMSELLNPEGCEFELKNMKINHNDGSSKELKVGRSFLFLEICYSTRVDFTNQRPNRKIRHTNITNDENIINDEFLPAKSLAPIEKLEINKFEENHITPGGFTIIEEITPKLKMTEQIQSNTKKPPKKQDKKYDEMDAQTKKLDLDIRRLCLETIDLLLANLPLPELAEEYRASNVMVRSIHKYINSELLENHHDGGESI